MKVRLWWTWSNRISHAFQTFYTCINKSLGPGIARPPLKGSTPARTSYTDHPRTGMDSRTTASISGQNAAPSCSR